jgi:hypothetical protein
MSADEPHPLHPGRPRLQSVLADSSMFIVHMLFLNAVADDAFITFRYARRQ